MLAEQFHRWRARDITTGEYWQAQTLLGSSQRFDLHFFANIESKLIPKPINFGDNQTYCYEANDTDHLTTIPTVHQAGKWDFQLWACASREHPSHFALIGDQSKWVPVSN